MLYPKIASVNSNTTALNRKYLLKGLMSENETKEFQLGILSAYLLTMSYIGNSNVNSTGDIAIITTGGSSSNTSKITWITNNCNSHECFSFDTNDGLKFKISISTGIWMVVSLTTL